LKRKLPVINVTILVLLGIVLIFYQFEHMENSRLLEERRQELMDKLANNLSHFNPTLDAFVDEDYRNTIASIISSKGICEFDRGLAKNQSPFGNYIVKYDLKNMEVIYEKLEVTNANYLEEWREFKNENKQ
jgi:hypothetical protein